MLEPGTTPPDSSNGLARRLEAAEAQAARWFAEAMNRIGAEAVFEPIAGGVAVFAGPVSPMTEAKGLALDGPIREGDLDRLAAFFADRGATARVSVCPLADPSLVAGLGRRGFRALEFESVLARPLDAIETPPLNPAIRVRPAGPDDAELHREIAFANFFDLQPLPREILDMGAALYEMDGAHHFLADLDGEPVGGGSLLVHEGVAMLAGAGTLAAFRNRGVQRALQVTRWEFARRLGCDLLVQMAAPGSASERNAQRLGLVVRYTKVILVREVE